MNFGFDLTFDLGILDLITMTISTNGTHYHIECFLCRKVIDEKVNNTACKHCGGPLDVVYDYEMLKNQMNSYVMQTVAPSMLKYLDFYPLINRQHLKTLGEGNTPLYHAQNLGKKLRKTLKF